MKLNKKMMKCSKKSKDALRRTLWGKNERRISPVENLEHKMERLNLSALNKPTED